MKNWSVRKIIVWALVIAFIVGSIIVGGPFNLIDMLIVRPIVNIQFMIFNWVHDFGIAIVIFAVLVKLVLWPLTKKQLKQTRLMQKIQPELTQIRKNCNGNKQMESLQTMDLYKRYNVKPFSSILVLLIQLPIFIAVFSAIRVIATPVPTDNLSNRVYDFVAYEGSEIRILEEEQQNYLSVKYDENLTQEERDAAEYNFHPSLFGVIDLTAKASDVIVPSRFSWSAVFMLVIAALASFSQYFASKMQMPSGKAEKSKSFRRLLAEAKEGKELDETDVSNLTSSQMNKMMPIMMFVIMVNLHGALAFYYFLSNVFTIVQQKIIYARARDDMDDNTDRAILRELKKAEKGNKIRGNKIQEAEIVENKKTGTKITRISAKDNKKKRR